MGQRFEKFDYLDRIDFDGRCFGCWGSGEQATVDHGDVKCDVCDGKGRLPMSGDNKDARDEQAF